MVLVGCNLFKMDAVLFRLLVEKLLFILHLIFRLADHLEAGQPVIISRLLAVSLKIEIALHIFKF